MNSLVKVFSNFKEFYSEINGATLTGAIDVIVVEQPDGTFHCSPFHVRFGKLGVLRSREKVVDILINGEPVDIHMKLGDSGEAFFVEECPESDGEELPANLATSPIPVNFLSRKYSNDGIEGEDRSQIKTASDDLQMPLPRRNSIDFSKEAAKIEAEPKFENQVSDYSHRRHTDNTLERRNLNEKLKEFTTQKLRQEWAVHEEIFNSVMEKGKEKEKEKEKEKNRSNSSVQADEKQTAEKQCEVKETDVELKQEDEEGQDNDSPITFALDAKLTADATTKETTITKNDASNNAGIADSTEPSTTNIANISNTNTAPAPTAASTSTAIALNDQIQNSNSNANSIKDESKGKKKRRKKSQMKKKNAQRKSSSSSLCSSGTGQENVNDVVEQNIDEIDTLSMSISNKSTPSIESSVGQQQANQLMTAGNDDSEICQTTSAMTPPSTRIPDLDIHFFSDTEITSSSVGPMNARGVNRPSSPIQSDSELEISMREKDSDDLTASWKWGELPIDPIEATIENSNSEDPPTQAQRKSIISGMFNFMKKTNKMRQQAGNDGGVYLSDIVDETVDPEISAMYFPIADRLSKINTPAQADAQAASPDDDRESGNGTSLPLSPVSLDGQKSSDSDYEDGKPREPKYLDFVAMSLCGLSEKGEPTEDEFDSQLIKYSDVCANPSLFSSPNLVVRLNGKFYSWAAACPIVMTIITFQKPLTNDAIEQLMAKTKPSTIAAANNDKMEVDGGNAASAGQAKRSWWYWRRSQTGGVTATTAGPKVGKNDDKTDDNEETDNAQMAVATTQTSRPESPDDSETTFSKTDSTLNAENTSAIVENYDDLSQYSRETANIKSERYKKSLRLSSDAIKHLNLKEGMNELEFSVTTAYQGTSRCKCCLFLWRYDDKVVISDIDGTITKSDVLGHLLPMVGKDWAQLGVAQLFSKIEQNGYKLLYLSARAIGQSRATREYLRSIRQGDVRLPDGPLLLNPTSLISAFHREVIEKKPEQFKIACLSDIRDLFPDKDPFYAGYGNRINDVWAYRAVGIPIMRIFTINTKGELKHELTQTFQSSYCSMTNIVDQLFPPIKLDEASIEFSNFNYWRDPIPELDLNLDGSGGSGGNKNGSASASANGNTNAIVTNAGTAITALPSAKINTVNLQNNNNGNA